MKTLLMSQPCVWRGSTQIASGESLAQGLAGVSLTGHKKEAGAKGCILCTGLFPEVLVGGGSAVMRWAREGEKLQAGICVF